MAGELFSESQVGELIRRAVELQESGSENSYVPGVTPKELEKICAEMGINPKYLQLAIAESQNVQPKQKKKFSYTDIERVYPIEIAPDDFDVITEYVKSVPNYTVTGGTTSGIIQLGKTIQGKASGGWAMPDFKVSSRDGRTKVTVKPDTGSPVGYAMLTVFPFVLSIVAFRFSVWLGIAGLVACIILTIKSFQWLRNKSQEITVETAENFEKAIVEYEASQANRFNQLAKHENIIENPDQTQSQSI